MTGGDERERSMGLLRDAVAATSQAEVARRIGRSAAAINQVLKGSYAGNPDLILELIAAEYGGDEVDCPVMGRIALIHCIENRRIEFSATNHQRVRLWKECRACEYNRGKS